MRAPGLSSMPRNQNNPYPSPHGFLNRTLRAAWSLTNLLLFRPTPRWLHGWRRMLLRTFGATIGTGAHVYPSVRIWAPWNLEMGDHSCLGPYVDCYNVAKISLGRFCTVSQYSYLCAATHDYTRATLPLIARPVVLEDWVWVAADAFIGPGVTVHEGAVVGARSSVYSSVEPWTVVVGNPARGIKKRNFLNDL